MDYNVLMDDFSLLPSVLGPPPRETRPYRSKYTPAMVRRLCKGLRKGLSRKLAAAYAGISVSYFYDCLSQHGEFEEAVERAEAEACAKWLDCIEDSVDKGQWQPAAWKLERRHPEAYARRERVTVDVSERLKAVAEELGMSMEEVEAEAQRVAMLSRPRDAR